jgi:hypothetical protein
MTGSGHALSLSIAFLMLERLLIITNAGLHMRHQSLVLKLSISVCGGVWFFIPVNAMIRELPLQPLTGGLLIEENVFRVLK